MYRNILLVDDDEDIIQMVSQFLEQTGFAVKSAKDGYSALEEIFSRHYDLVILDKAIPFVSGDQVIKTLRQGTLTKNLPIIMLSANIDPSEIARSKSFGVDEYLTKPLDKKLLAETIERILGTRPNPDEINFNEMEGKLFGQESPAISILSIGAGGMLLKCISELKVGIPLSNEKLKLFELLEIEISPLKVNSCQLRGDKAYEVFISFLPLSKNEIETIRECVKAKTFKMKVKTASRS